MKAGVREIAAFQCEVCDCVHTLRADAEKCCVCRVCGKKKSRRVQYGEGCCPRCSLRMRVKDGRESVKRAARDLRSLQKYLNRNLRELERLEKA